MTIKIEKGIPAPLDAATLAHEMKEMAIGDSFFVAECSDRARQVYIRAAAILPNFVMVSGAEEQPSASGGEPIKGLRFWRVAARTTRKYKAKAT